MGVEKKSRNSQQKMAIEEKRGLVRKYARQELNL